MTDSIFISYAGEDQRWADWVHAHLVAWGYDTELATLSWPNGSELTGNIEAALAKNSCMVCLLSKDYFKVGKWSRDELSSAWEWQYKSDLKLLFFLLEEMEPPPPFNTRVNHSFFGRGEIECRRLLQEQVAIAFDKGKLAQSATVNADLQKPHFPGFDRSMWLPKMTAFQAQHDVNLVQESERYLEDTNQRLRKIPPQYQIEALLSDIFNLAQMHGYEPPSEVLRTGLGILSQLNALKEESWKPSFLNEAHVAEALLCGVMAYGALDMGLARQAFRYSSVMNEIGEAIENPALSAWALGTKSLITRFEGLNTRFEEKNAESLSYAMSGLELDVSERCAARLHGQAALCLANIEQYESVENPLEKSARGCQKDWDRHDFKAGIFNYGRAKHEYYAGIAYLKTKRFEVSANHSLNAIKLFGEGDADTNSISDTFLAHIHLAAAHLGCNKLELIEDDLEPLFTMPRKYRTSWHISKLEELSAKIRQAGSLEASSRFDDRIASFLTA